MDDPQLVEALREHAYLEGDFVLRSGKRSRYYLDKFRFETQPDVLRVLGERIAAAVREAEPDADRLACPVLGAVILAASASLASGLPFVVVRDEAKEYGTANRLEVPSIRASASASWRTSSPPAARSSRRCTRCARRASSAARRCALSTEKKAASMPSRGRGCASGHCSAPATSARHDRLSAENRIVERKRRAC